MSKLINLMRRNPRMTIGSIILVIAIVAVVIWLVSRKDDVATGPQLEVTGEKIVKSTTTSEYSIMKREYETGVAKTEYRGWNIDFTVNVKTKGGFEEAGIKRIKIERYDDSSTSTVLQTMYIDDVKNYRDYSPEFLGSELSKNAVSSTTGGYNTFKLYGVTSEQDATKEVLYTGSGTSTTPVLLATTNVNITEAELNYTIGNASKSAFTFNLTSTSGSTIPVVTKTGFTRTKYKLSIDPYNKYSLVPNLDAQGGVVSGQYKFKKDDDTFLITTDNIDVFKIDNSYSGKVRLYNVGNTKFLTREGGALNGNLVLKTPQEMSDDEASVSLMTMVEPGELDGDCLIGPYPGDNVTTKDSIGNVNQLIWSVRNANLSGVTHQANQINFWPGENIDIGGFPNDLSYFKITLSTIDPVKNTYQMIDGGGDFVTYGGDRKRMRYGVWDPSYAVTFEKQSQSVNNGLPKYLMKDADDNTFWLGDNWKLDGSDRTGSGDPQPVTVFRLEVGKEDGAAWTAQPMTYYSCSGNKDVGCNGAPGTGPGIEGMGVGYVSQHCKAGSYMYC